MYKPTKLLIFGKTYPELSTRHTETVCTGAFREDGRPVRLYPVPLRYLEGEQQYRLYEWITVPIEKSTKDPRPESFRVDASRLTRHDVVPTDRDGWRQRREIVFRDPSWHFGTMDQLRDAQQSTGCSIGMVKPGAIEDVQLLRKSDEERLAHEQKSRELEDRVNADFFLPDYKQLEYLPCEIRLLWRCPDACSTCRNRPHDMRILDWGLLELARREGWDSAVNRMREITDLTRYDFRLYLGTFRLHMQSFGIIGLWYPPVPVQPLLL